MWSSLNAECINQWCATEQSSQEIGKDLIYTHVSKVSPVGSMSFKPTNKDVESSIKILLGNADFADNYLKT